MTSNEAVVQIITPYSGKVLLYVVDYKDDKDYWFVKEVLSAEKNYKQNTFLRKTSLNILGTFLVSDYAEYFI